MATAEPPPPPEPLVRDSRLVSLVWLVPIAAVLIGGWLVWDTLRQRGPDITIELANAEGIEADKTRIRLLDVEVGVVTEVRVAPSLDRVLVTARMVKEAEAYLRTGTRFWVVGARVGLGGVSGLSTLLSGSHIAVEPGEGEPSTRFVALETPPPVASTAPGRRFVLTTPTLGNVGRGAGVFYRGLRVGQITDYRLAADGRSLEVDVFVADPMADLVREDTHFWLANGIDVAVEGAGLRVTMTSLEAFLTGGVEFAGPPLSTAPAAADGRHFPLYAGPTAAEEADREVSDPFVAYFEGDVGGLRPGSPVLFRGIRIGRVLDVRLELAPDGTTIRAPVVFDLFRERVPRPAGATAGRERLDRLVEMGLRAQMRSTNIVTGELAVALEMLPDAAPAAVDWEHAPPIVPSVPSTLDALQATVQGVLAAIQRLPLEEIGQDLRQAVGAVARLVQNPALAAAIEDAGGAAAGFQTLIAQLDAQLPTLLGDARAAAAGADEAVRELRRTLAAATRVLAATETVVAGVETVPYDTQRLLQELRVLTRSLTSFVDYLERDPSALLRGRR